MSYGAIPVHWRVPSDEVLREAYERGLPPFDRFPTITELAKAYCSRAVLNAVFWGRNAMAPEDLAGPRGLGVYYHMLIGALRRALSARGSFRLPPGPLSAIKTRARHFAEDERRKLSIPEAVWTQLLGLYFTYIGRKVKELRGLSNQILLTEVDVINPKCRFVWEGHVRHYPLRGRLDEVNLTTGTIIERTTEEDDMIIDPRFPTSYKVLQAWLGACALRSLPPDLRPLGWEKVWNDKAPVKIETPTQDIELQTDSNWINRALYGYLWIKSLSRQQPGIMLHLRTGGYCNESRVFPGCPHYRLDCIRAVPPYPQSRPQFFRRSCMWASRLLWSEVWTDDLWYWRLTRLPKQDLIERGMFVPSVVMNVRDDYLTVQPMQRLEAQPFIVGDAVDVVSGTTWAAASRLRAEVLRVEDDGARLVLRLQERNRTTELTEQVGLSTGAPAALSGQPLGWLFRLQRSALRRCHFLGARSRTQAEATYTVRVIDALFGLQPIKTGGASG